MVNRFRFPTLLALVVALIVLGILSSESAVSAAAHGPPGKVNPRTTAVIDYVSPKFGGPKHPGPHGSGGGDAVAHSAGHFELIGGVWADADLNPAAVDPKLAFVIDLRGFPAGSDTAILDAFGAWEAVTGGDLFDEAGTAFQNANVAFGDGVNTYSMRNLGGRVLAATFITWDDADNDGAIDTGETFLEMDVVFNSTVKWATDTTAAGAKGKWFDVQNVATHEDGHVFGLDHPGDAHPEDNEQTMFASAAPKETKKRSLELTGDIPGINADLLGY